MSTQEQAMVCSVKDENQQESVLRRSEAEVDNPSDSEAVIRTSARINRTTAPPRRTASAVYVDPYTEVGIERLAANFPRAIIIVNLVISSLHIQAKSVVGRPSTRHLFTW